MTVSLKMIFGRLICLVTSLLISTITARPLMVQEFSNFTMDCPVDESTQTMWWVKDKMTVLSINGQELTLAAALLWPASHDKFALRLDRDVSYLTLRNVSFQDASQVNF